MKRKPWTPTHQVDARLDPNAAEQGIYADPQVAAAEDIRARPDDGEAKSPPLKRRTKRRLHKP